MTGGLIFIPNDAIFVFGSNYAGVHGAGAARFALQHKGAVYGIGEGLMGQSYALPTKDQAIRTISRDLVNVHVDRFCEFAERNQNMIFQVTAIGCGLAGYEHQDIAPMFSNAPANCFFDSLWYPYMPAHFNYWGTF